MSYPDYQSSYKRQLQINESVTHNITEYKCDKCDFTAKRKQYISQHELRFHGTEEYFVISEALKQCGGKV